MTRRTITAMLLAATVGILGSARIAAAQGTVEAGAGAAEPVRVGFLVLDGVYNSELMAPFDIFHHTRFHADPGMTLCTIGRTNEPVTSFEGLRIAVEYALEDAPPLDVLVVPSAEHNLDADLDDRRLIAWVAERGRAARFVLSVCDGAFVLAQAGLLDRRVCTTFPGDVAAFRARFGAKLRIVEGATFVVDGPAITGVGGGRSYEPALWLVEHLYGAEVAAGVARGMVLDWDAERVRALVMPRSTPACYLPGDRVHPLVTLTDERGDAVSLRDLAERADVHAVILIPFGGAEADDVARRGGLWCEDSFNELPNLRYLHRQFEGRGVLFVGVACPPVFHEERFGYDEGAFDERDPPTSIQMLNRRTFVDRTERLVARAGLPFDEVVYDLHLHLLRAPESGGAPWMGRFKWFDDTQAYGTPTVWVLTPDLEVAAPPFARNVYESEGRKLRFSARDIELVVERVLADGATGQNPR